MTEDLEAKLEEYRVWALTLGHYSSSTVTRSARRIRELSRVIDVLHPKQKQVLDFFAKERTRGVKLHGFGVKLSALRTETGQYLYSTDSLSWAWDRQQKGKQHRAAGTYYGIKGKLADLRRYLAEMDEISKWDQKMITQYGGS